MNDALEPLALPTPAPARKHRRLSAIWIVPILAVLVAGVAGARAWLTAGPTVTITFDTAEGLEAGKSELRFRNVPVGKVESVAIAHDRKHIVATVRLAHDAAVLAVKDSRFWVERPRIGIGGVSGLGTVLTGAYIGVDVGSSTEKADHFVGLAQPPGVTRDDQGGSFRLTAPDAGSLTVGSPVYYKRVSVGAVAALELAPDGKQVAIDVFVRAPYAKLVTASTVFWNASGLDVTIDGGGLRLDTQSLATVVAGGLAFGERDGVEPGPPLAAADHRPDVVVNPRAPFALFPDRNHAMARPDGLAVHVAMRFVDDTRGVAPGTPIDFRGVPLGTVDAVEPGYDARAHAFYADVVGTIYPERLGGAYAALAAEGAARGKSGPDMLRVLVDERGLHAQIKSANIVTGAAFIALALGAPSKPSGARAVALDGALAIPTARGGIDHLSDEVNAIVEKVGRIPFAQIGDEVAKAVGALRTNIAERDSSLQESVRETLKQLENAARSVRTLTDYLSRHPEAILRGKGK